MVEWIVYPEESPGNTVTLEADYIQFQEGRAMFYAESGDVLAIVKNYSAIYKIPPQKTMTPMELKEITNG